MATNIHSSKWLLLALLPLATASGCFCLALPLPGENQCPTDARRLYCTCGEEAVRRCPCGPDREFYGLKPTCWREWPEGWQCNGCEGFPYVDRELCGAPVAEVATKTEQVIEQPVVEKPEASMPECEEADFSNPWRSTNGAAELPLPPEKPQPTPTPSAPPTPAKEPAATQPTPAVPPAATLEKTSAAPAPTTKDVVEQLPEAKSPTSEKPKLPATSVAVEQPKKPVEIPPAPVAQAEPAPPQLLPPIPAAVKITAAAPTLLPPQNAVAKETEIVAPPIPKPVQKWSTPKIDKKLADVIDEPKTKRVHVASAPAAEPKSEVMKVATPVAKAAEEDPNLSNRVERHLHNNIQL